MSTLLPAPFMVLLIAKLQFVLSDFKRCPGVRSCVSCSFSFGLMGFGSKEYEAAGQARDCMSAGREDFKKFERNCPPGSCYCMSKVTYWQWSFKSIERECAYYCLTKSDRRGMPVVPSRNGMGITVYHYPDCCEGDNCNKRNLSGILQDMGISRIGRKKAAAVTSDHVNLVWTCLVAGWVILT